MSDPLSNPFRNPSGARYLKGLFYETLGSDKSTVVYTLKDHDHKGYVSLYRLYMEANDLTEYRFAMSHLDGWEHWEMLTECEWFKPVVARWRKELELRMRAEALASIIETSKASSNPNAYHANKYLLEGAWKLPGDKKAGRPTKEAIAKEATRIAISAKDTASDLERVLGKAN